MRTVPLSWWASACEKTSSPLACVADDNYFVWCNSAYEQLVGYSLAELQRLTWQDITLDEDIGADQRNVQLVLTGFDQSYQMEKRYKHKRGYIVPITLTVWKHQSESTGNRIYLIAQAMPEHATIEQLTSIRAQMQTEFAKFQERLSIIEKAHMQRRNIQSGNKVTIGDRNSIDIVKWLVVALVALAGVVAYLGYVGTWSQHKGEAEPPKIELPIAADEKD